jgi:SAM-dependent methyltransferase
MTFRNSEESHAHSLETLNWLYEHDDFMASVDTLIDIGCGAGLDLEWWATRTTREENPVPLDINCTGLDIAGSLPIARKYSNVTYQQNNFEQQIYTPKKKKYDVLWCHDAFQYAVRPLDTLKLWWDIAEPGAMLILILPQTTNIEHKKLLFNQPNGCYYHYTIVNLIHMLAVSGWDCAPGFFKKSPTDPWLHAVVYRSEHRPMDPASTSWYQLADLGLLPKTAFDSVQKHGGVHQDELVLPWLDKNLTWFGQH